VQPRGRGGREDKKKTMRYDAKKKNSRYASSWKFLFLEILEDVDGKDLRNVHHKTYVYTAPSQRNKTGISTARP
jgi:hypothetical protein